MDYRVQRLKEDLTNAQQRNKKQRIQLSNYKKVHERDLEIIKKYKEVIEKIKTRYIDYYGTTKEVNDDYVLRNVLKEISDLLKEVE